MSDPGRLKLLVIGVDVQQGCWQARGMSNRGTLAASPTARAAPDTPESVPAPTWLITCDNTELAQQCADLGFIELFHQ